MSTLAAQPHAGAWSLLLEIVILLLACLALGAICSRLRQSPLVGYLLAGMFLGGPGSLHVIQAEAHIEAIAELGVALLLFSLGLEFSWARLVSLGARTLGAGAIQVVLTALAAFGLGLLFRLSTVEAIALGAMVSLSSTAAVLRVLVDRGEIDSGYGRNALAVLLVQDMAVVPLALLMALLAEGGTPGEVAMNVVRIVGVAAALIAVLYLVLNHVAVRALNVLSIEQNRELTVLLAVVVGLGSTWAAHAAELSPALGAFVAGMFLGSSPFATQVRGDISSLRIVLLTLFFGAVGIVADPILILENFGMVAAITGLVLLVKTVIIWAIFRTLGHSTSIAVATGMCLSQIGEFAFVLGSAAKAGGVIDDDLSTIVVSCAIVSLFLTPYLVQLAPAVGLWVTRWTSRARGQATVTEDSPSTPHAEVVIIGFGPAGQAVGRMMAEQRRSTLVIDLNPAGKRQAEVLGLHGVIGDATSLEVLEHAHIESARLVLITLPARSAAISVLQNVRCLAPHAHLVVRSRYAAHRSDFEREGAHVVIGDEEEVGSGLAVHVGEHITSWPSRDDAMGRLSDESPADS